MAIGIITGIVLFVLAFVFGMIAFVNWDGPSKAAPICLVLAILMAVAFVIVPFSFHTINTGEIAVVKHLGKITHVRGAGANFDLWFLNSYQKYDTKVQNVEITTAAYSSDAQTMEVNMTLQYQIMSDKVIDIATQYGSLEALQNRIQSIAVEKTKAVLSSYKAMNIIADRAAISPAVEAAIKDAIGDEYFVNVNTVVLTNIDFSDAFELAVEEKMIAEQSKLKADYENQKKIALAEADIEIAKAKAEAMMIEANAEAEANRIVAESLTQEILDKILADAWDGKLPEVVGNGDYILPADIFE